MLLSRKPLSTGDLNNGPFGPPGTTALSREPVRYPYIQWHGGKAISGTVTVSGSGPIRARVFLCHRLSGQVVQRTTSDATGAYIFTGWSDQEEFFAVAVHPTRAFNAAPADAVYPA